MSRDKKMRFVLNEMPKTKDTRTLIFGLRSSVVFSSSFFFLLFFFLFLILSFSDLSAQCAMCRAVAESSPAENSIAAGLNTGILYLLAAPYLLIGGVVFIFFKKQIAEKIKSLKK